MATAQLEKARLLAKEVDVDLTVCFNPKELSVEKSAAWEPLSKVDDEPQALFGPTSPASMSVTLIFDTYEDKVSVYKKYTSHLEKLIHVISNEVRRPPLTHFVWGAFVFHGVVANLSQKYTMFLANGLPVRAECTLKMQKARGAMSRRDTSANAQPDRNLPWTRLWSNG